jgi:hypothetical protein
VFLVYPIALMIAWGGCRQIWLRTPRLPSFWRILMVVLQVVMVSFFVAAAYFHIGRYAEICFGAAMLAFATMMTIGLLLKDQIDLNRA